MPIVPTPLRLVARARQNAVPKSLRFLILKSVAVVAKMDMSHMREIKRIAGRLDQ
jgi:hypothetical protein